LSDPKKYIETVFQETSGPRNTQSKNRKVQFKQFKHWLPAPESISYYCATRNHPDGLFSKKDLNDCMRKFVDFYQVFQIDECFITEPIEFVFFMYFQFNFRDSHFPKSNLQKNDSKIAPTESANSSIEKKKNQIENKLLEYMKKPLNWKTEMIELLIDTVCWELFALRKWLPSMTSDEMIEELQKQFKIEFKERAKSERLVHFKDYFYFKTKNPKIRPIEKSRINYQFLIQNFEMSFLKELSFDQKTIEYEFGTNQNLMKKLEENSEKFDDWQIADILTSIHQQWRIIDKIRYFLRQSFVRDSGDYDEPIERHKIQEIQTIFSILINQPTSRLKSTDKAIKHKFTPVPLNIWFVLLNSDNYRLFYDDNLEVEFFGKAMRAFSMNVLTCQLQDFFRLKLNQITTIDPETRQSIREANRARSEAAYPLKPLFDKSQPPVLFLNTILAKNSVFSKIKIQDLTVEFNPITEILNIFLDFLELGLLDSFSCDFLLTTLDEFASRIQNMTTKEPEHELLNDSQLSSKLLLFPARAITLEILLHITSVYCDEGYQKEMKQGLEEKEDVNLFVLEEKTRFQNMSHIISRFCLGFTTSNKEFDVIDKVYPQYFENFKSLCVQLLIFLNDPMSDHFVDSWNFIKSRKSLQLKRATKEQMWNETLFLKNLAYICQNNPEANSPIYQIPNQPENGKGSIFYNIQKLLKLLDAAITQSFYWDNIAEISKILHQILFNSGQKPDSSDKKKWEFPIAAYNRFIHEMSKNTMSKKNAGLLNYHYSLEDTETARTVTNSNPQGQVGLGVPAEENIDDQIKREKMFEPYSLRLQFYIIVNKIEEIELLNWKDEFLKEWLEYRNSLATYEEIREFCWDFLKKKTYISPEIIYQLRSFNVVQQIGVYLSQYMVQYKKNYDYENKNINEFQFFLNNLNSPLFDRFYNIKPGAKYNDIFSSYFMPNQNAEAENHIEKIFYYLALIIQSDLGLKTSLFSDGHDTSSMTNSRIGINAKSIDESWNLDVQNKFVLDTIQNNLPRNYCWSVLCFAQPLNFTKFIKTIYSGDFDIFLNHRDNFIVLMKYYELTLRNFEATFLRHMDYWSMIELSNKKWREKSLTQPEDNFDFSTWNSNVLVFKETSLRLKFLEKAVLIWNDLILGILAEYSRQDNHMKGYHYFSRVYVQLYTIVYTVVFTEGFKSGKNFQDLQKPREFSADFFEIGSRASANLQDPNSPAKPEGFEFLYKISPDLKLSFLKLFNMSNSWFFNGKLMNPIKTHFKLASKAIFNMPIFEGHTRDRGKLELKKSLQLRGEFFSMYNQIFNFEKNSALDEFVLWVMNPDISNILDKFRPEDFNSIYGQDNIEFLITEGNQIIQGLEIALNNFEISTSVDEKNKSLGEKNFSNTIDISYLENCELPNYAFEYYMPAIYKLFKGMSTSYYTKIRDINFKQLEMGLTKLTQIFKRISALTIAYFTFTSSNRSGVEFGNLFQVIEERLRDYCLEIDNSAIDFRFEMVYSLNERDETEVNDGRMRVINTLVCQGVDSIIVTLSCFQEIYSEIYKFIEKDKQKYSSFSKSLTETKNLLNKILGWFYENIWQTESEKLYLTNENIFSFAEYSFNRPLKDHWSGDENFVIFMNLIQKSLKFSINQKTVESPERRIEECMYKARLWLSELADNLNKTRLAEDKVSLFVKKYKHKLPNIHDKVMVPYLESKSSQKNQEIRKYLWIQLFDSKLSKLGARQDNSPTEPEENLKTFSKFLVSLSLVYNYYDPSKLFFSLSYFDVNCVQFHLCWDYFMRNIPLVEDACNISIDRYNQRETSIRNLVRFDTMMEARTTPLENFYELFFNLLNMMYWRINDKHFKWMYKQFVILNQLMRRVVNVREITAIVINEKEARVRNPIDQILKLLKFFTENSRIYQNKDLKLKFSDRVGDLPLFNVLLSTLSFAVKKYQNKYIDLESNYFQFMHNIMVRKDLDRKSQIYQVQSVGIDAALSFLLKGSSSTMASLWNSFDHLALYNQMIWLVKFWFVGKAVIPKYKKKIIDSPTYLQHTWKSTKKNASHENSRNSTLDQLDMQSNFAGFEENINLTNNEIFEQLMDEEMSSVWDNYFAKIGWFGNLNFSNNAEDYFYGKFLAFRDLCLLISDSKLPKNKSMMVIRDLINKYKKIEENQFSLEAQPVKTAAQIFIFLKYLSSNVSPVQNFMKEKEKKANKFNLKGTKYPQHQINSILAEYKVLLFLGKIVKRIEAHWPIFEEQKKVELTSIYFRCNPISLFLTSAVAQDFIQVAPYENIQAQHTYLLEKADDMINQLTSYQKITKWFWPAIFIIDPGTVRIMKLMTVGMCTLVNILMIVYIQAPDNGYVDLNYLDNGKYVLLSVGILFGVVASIYHVINFFYFCLIKTWSIREEIEKTQEIQESYRTVTFFEKAGFHIKGWWNAFVENFWLSFFTVVFAFLGTFFNHIFHTLSFMFFVLELRFFRYIAWSFIQDLRSLGLLFIFLMILILAYAYLIMVYFANDPDAGSTVEQCPYMVSCFFNTFMGGYLPGGGIGDSIPQMVLLKSDRFWGSYFLTISYFLLIKQILFNTVFGIIQDNFGNYREEKEIEEERNLNCYICDADVYMMERSNQSFKKHTRQVHNLWAYQDYLIYLKNSPYSSLTDYDIETRKKIESFDFSWIPQKDWLANQYRSKIVTLKNMDDDD
jgi:hypothetical protein